MRPLRGQDRCINILELVYPPSQGNEDPSAFKVGDTCSVFGKNTSLHLKLGVLLHEALINSASSTFDCILKPA